MSAHRTPLLAWISAALLIALIWAIATLRLGPHTLQPGGTETPTAEATPPPVYLPYILRDPTPTPTLTNTPRPATHTPVPPTWTPWPTSRPEPTSRPCCRCCTRGTSKPCGDTCISQSRTCRTPPGCACFCTYDPMLGEEICADVPTAVPGE